MFYIKDGIRYEMDADNGEINYTVGKIVYRASIGCLMTAYVDLSFTTVNEYGQRRYKKDYRDCIVEEVVVKKPILRDEEGYYFESNDLRLTAGGISLGPVFVPDTFKIRLETTKESA